MGRGLTIIPVKSFCVSQVKPHDRIALPRMYPLSRFAALVLLSLAFASVGSAYNWPKIDPSEFEVAPSKIDPEAGVEIIRREVEIDHSDPSFGALYSQYNRLIVLNEQGAEKLARFEILSDRNGRITRVQGRTIKKDGTIIPLEERDIFEREIIRAGGETRRAKVFAAPGIEPGAIFEYWYEDRRDGVSSALTMIFQSQFPARYVQFRYLPYLKDPSFGVRFLFFNVPKTEIRKDSTGVIPFEAKDVPAWRSEPFQPAVIQMQRAIVAYYSRKLGASADDYWNDFARDLYKKSEAEAKATKRIQALLAQITSPEDDPKAKLQKIYDYCSRQIPVRNRDTARFTREERRKFKTNESADDTLEAGHGTSRDVNVVFTALARAAGFNARFAMGNDRQLIIYTPALREPFIFSYLVSAVELNGQWQFFDPGAGYLPAGMIPWRYTATEILVAQPKQALIMPSPISPADASTTISKGRFRLDENGTLSGEVTLTATGHAQAWLKHSYDNLNSEERVDRVRDRVQVISKLAEVSEVRIEHADDPVEPIAIHYKVTIPGYAERTGSRFFVAPAVFRRGEKPVLDEPERRTSVAFYHPYQEKDHVEIEIPAGFEIEAGSAPGNVELGNFGLYETKLAYRPRARILQYERNFAIKQVGVPLPHYQAARELFRRINERDGHLLTFKKADAVPATPAAEPKP